jgi:hypothetical protein
MTEPEYRIKSMQWSIEAKEEEVEAAKKDIQELLNDMGGNFDCEVALRISRESATLLKAVAELKSLQTQKQLLVAMSTEEK